MSTNVKGECVQVMVRARPMNQREISNNSKNVIEIDKSVNQVILKDPSSKDQGRPFTFDAVYGIDST